MTQRELDQLVADATGEDVQEIRRRGFSIIESRRAAYDPEPCRPPQVVDWDDVDRRRNVALYAQPERPRRRTA